MTTDDVMGPIAKLRDEMIEIADRCGVELESFLIVPGVDGSSPHMAQALFHVVPSVAFATDEQRHFDEAFAEIAMTVEEEAATAAAAERREKLARGIAELKGGGILPEDE